MDVPLKVLHTVGCASRDSARYQLTSVYLERNGSLSATATDGKQLLHVTWKDEDETGPDFAGILSADSVKRILKVKDGLHETVEIPETIDPDSGTTGILRGEASLLPGADKVTVEGIDGVYPDYRSVMPRGHNFEIRVNPAILINTLQTMMKVLGETRKHCGTVVIRLQDEEHPIAIEGTKDGVTARGMVMPLVVAK